MADLLHVLILEDREADAELMLHALRKDGFEPDWQRVETETAYLAALEKNPDLVLADWSLPQFSGQRALKLIQERMLEIPFIIVSGSIGEDVAVEAMRDGAADYLIKDRLARLGGSVRRALEDTAIKKARKKAEETLRASENELRALFAAMHDIVMAIDYTGVYRKFAPTSLELYIKPPEELLGKNLREVFPKKQADCVINCIQQVLRTKRSAQIEYDLRIGDRVVTFETSIAPLDENTTLCVARDITARKRAEAKIIQLNAELETRVQERTAELRETQEQLVRHEKLAVLGRVAGSVSHELRNPLGIISSAVYYLKLIQPKANTTIREYHAMIEQEVRKSEHIIDDLLSFTRILTADRELVSVTELVQCVLESHPAPPSMNVTLKLPPDLPKVYTDPHQMEQALGNLVINAYQASPDKGKLVISARRQKGMLAIAVKDNGEGIPPENLPRLFEPLFTTRITGIGLGLSICQKLVEANCGRIEVISDPGKGSTFTLLLPIQDGTP
jgi:PAS domain S-box-containing protein